MATKFYSILLSEDEKLLFNEWLNSREESLMAQLQEIKLLRTKLEQDAQVSPPKREEPVFRPAPVRLPVQPKPFTDRQQSWTNKIIGVFKQLNKSLISKEIIDWFIINDETVKHKDRSFVSKSVTSKLAVLEEKGILRKDIIDKKHVYTMVNERATDDHSSSLF